LLAMSKSACQARAAEATHRVAEVLTGVVRADG